MSQEKKHLHVIGIGGIGISALARYYQHLGYSVSGSDGSDSPFLDTLRSEGFEIFLDHDAKNLSPQTDLVVYSEAIITKPDLSPEEQIYANPELEKARDLWIRHLSYPVALGEIFNTKRGIAIAGSHGKSTTTAMTGIMLAQRIVEDRQHRDPHSPSASVLVGTQVPQLENSNFHFEESPFFVIEACEYKRSFLHYHPSLTVITNIDIDHLDYYHGLDDYISAFQTLVDQTREFVIISAHDENSKKLDIPLEKKIIVDSETEAKITYFPRVEEMKDGTLDIYTVEKLLSLPALNLQVPGKHLLHDAYLAYTVGKLLGMQDDAITQKLESYTGSWRRSEIVRTTKNGNLLMSDYGHHPNEIRPTLRAIREKYPEKKLLVIFQPHQYSRTRELLSEFAVSFWDADELIIPDIYFSRDKKEDVEWMTTDKLVTEIRKNSPISVHSESDSAWVKNGNGLKNTVQLIQEYDTRNPDSSLILLLGAGDVDTLRYEIF